MPLLDTTQYKDTLGTFVSELVLQVLSFVAEKEREDINRRQREGIESAKAKGKHLGRPKISLESLNEKQKAILKTKYESWKKNKITAVEFMNKMDLKKNSFYKIMKEYESGRH
ncbi:DNA invertase Pin-like site-specific DNA recombinase [Neobacillus ginsengisoli]|uniref:DNA invertase Pin-like site-specific DNA recombinase n=1 Tax=Neobacillus ginsengisoli TaxID=904295 RepID=A0ABT9XWB5_9BACI|nr:DNA invertase Pin-like site-specific DNA recombinase [Neobacillus ginsengisoli]